MKDSEFNPETWLRAGNAFSEEATAFQAAGRAVLNGASDLNALGAAGGSTVADQALAAVLPALFAEVSAAITAITDGLEAEADTLRESGKAYKATESTNTSLGSTERMGLA